MDEKKIKIAIIDSGIDTSIADLSTYVTHSTGVCINEEGYIVENPELPIRHPHGTMVALVIRHLCSNVELHSINILNECLAADGRVLLCAIELALGYQPDILHLSLGTTRWRYRFALNRLISKARQSNTVVVAAANNEGKKSYPAYLKGVIGAKGDEFLKNQLDMYFKNGFYFAPCEADSVPGVSEIATHIGGSSTAAAFISGHVARVISSGNKNKDLHAIEKSMRVYKNCQPSISKKEKMNV